MTPSLVALLLVIVAGLVVCSALFSGLETALFALRRHQLRRLESNYPALAGFVQKFRENPRRVLAVILLGSALVNVFLIVICLALLWETPRATPLPPWLIAVSLFAIIVFFCDLLPKLVALSAPYRLSALGVFTLRVLMPLLETVGSTLETISVAIVELVTPRHIRARSHLSAEELETLIQIGAEQGTLQAAEGEILSAAAPLGDTDLDIEPLAEGRYLVNGNARLDDLSERLGFDFDASGIDTIGGYVFNQLGRVPEVGTELETPRLKITVRRVNRRRIEELLLEKTVCAECDSDNGELP